MRKYDYISALAKETAAEVVKNREEWMRYLTTAARLYKYQFREQLLIYAQRPDATACASIELWNERMHCWVNKGAKGIALLDEDDAHGKCVNFTWLTKIEKMKLSNRELDNLNRLLKLSNQELDN